MSTPGLNVVDPLKVDPLQLTPAAIRYLSQVGLQMDARSPLLKLSERASPTTPEELAGARRALQDRGLYFGMDVLGGKSSPASGLYRTALEVLARPERMIRVIVQTPQGLETYPLYTTGDTVAPAWRDGANFYVGAAISEEAIRDAFSELLRSDRAAHDARELEMWPAQSGLLGALWEGQGRDPARSVPVVDAQKLLQQAGASSPDAVQVLKDLEGAGLLERRDGQLFLTASLREWMAILWSGHQLSLEAVDLTESEPHDDDWERFLFVGPPGRRALYVTYPAEGGAGEEEDQVIYLAHLTRREAEDRLQIFLTPAELFEDDE